MGTVVIRGAGLLAALNALFDTHAHEADGTPTPAPTWPLAVTNVRGHYG